MPDIAHIIQSGAANPWIYLPAALLLGALHALEPGHSKSMMAAFIIATRGTPWHAVLLGVSAAVGHTFVIWVLAVVGLSLGDKLILDKAEPWLVLATGVLLILIAVRIVAMLAFPGKRSAGHVHLAHQHGHAHQDSGHGHDHEHDHEHGPDDALGHCHDAHAAAHEVEVGREFAGRQATSVEIVWFGLTAGLLPCPAAFAVLLVCLQLKEVTLGVVMVAAFSIGLAATLVTVGVVAALGASASSRWLPGFDRWAHTLPYASAAIILVVGCIMSLHGLSKLAA